MIKNVTKIDPEETYEDEHFHLPAPIQPGSESHEAMLAGGYGMSKAEAEAIIKERDADPLTHPYDEYKKAKAMLAALNAKPKVISKKPGWKRDRNQVDLGY